MVTQPASVPVSTLSHVATNAKFANYPTRKLIHLGVKPSLTTQNQPVKAGLIELITQVKNEYWIAYPNFFVITRYNSSPQYALAVYLLAEQLKSQRAKNSMKKKHAFA